MGKKIVGIVLVVFGLLLGVLFCGQVFMHGWNEGLIRAEQFRTEDVTWAVGSVFFLVVGLTAFAWKKKK